MLYQEVDDLKARVTDLEWRYEELFNLTSGIYVSLSQILLGQAAFWRYAHTMLTASAQGWESGMTMSSVSPAESGETPDSFSPSAIPEPFALSSGDGEEDRLTALLEAGAPQRIISLAAWRRRTGISSTNPSDTGESGSTEGG